MRTLLVACLASCVASPTSPLRPQTTEVWLARFHDAMQFVPGGMSSWWFSDLRGVLPMEGLEAQLFVEVRCGRNFESPLDFGVGHYEGVTIEDWGTHAIPAERRANFLEPQPAIDGIEVWAYREVGPSLRDVPFRVAVVDQRFVVVATSEPLLREALQRTGAPRFGSLEPLPAIDPATVALVVRDLVGKAAPADKPLLFNVPGVSAVATLLPSPWRVRTWGRQEAELVALTRRCFEHHFKIAPAQRGADFWSIELSVFPEFLRDPMDVISWLGLAIFFGYCICI